MSHESKVNGDMHFQLLIGSTLYGKEVHILSMPHWQGMHATLGMTDLDY